MPSLYTLSLSQEAVFHGTDRVHKHKQMGDVAAASAKKRCFCHGILFISLLLLGQDLWAYKGSSVNSLTSLHYFVLYTSIIFLPGM